MHGHAIVAPQGAQFVVRSNSQEANGIVNPTLKFDPHRFRGGLLGAHIADVIERAKAQIHAKRLNVRLNLETGTGGLACPESVGRAVDEAIHDAIERSPDRGEVTVVGVLTSDGLQIEIDDEGPWDDQQRNCAFASCSTETEGLRKAVARVPQGGRAVSLLWQKPLRRAMVA